MRVLAIVLCLGSAVAGAREAADAGKRQDPHALLQRGVALHRDAAYAPSVAALEQARLSPSLDPTEQAECAFYLGADYVALNSIGAARRELRAALEANPGYELPQYTSPKVAALFREVKDELEKLPRLRALPPRRKTVDRIELWFEASRTGGTVFGAVMWRWRGEGSYHEAPLSHADDRLLASVSLQQNGMLEYYAEARGPAGFAQSASREHPLELPVTGVPNAARGSAELPGSSVGGLGVADAPEPKKRSVVKSWWLWTTVGAVAAAGLGVGLYFALRPPSGGTADAVLDFQVR